MKKTTPDNILKALISMVDFFQRHRIPYALIGAMALNIYGRPRTTLDIDFLILSDEADFSNINDMASTEDIRPDEEWAKWNPMIAKGQVRFIVKDISIDVMLPRDEHDMEALKRKRRKKIGKKMLSIITPEDFILQKLKVGRPRDFEDAVTVLERQSGNLDIPYIQGWASRLGVSNELDYILNL
jgi:hypothetical protein